ncbi:MAG: phosphotransacetylase [Candidatus Nanopelagicales bacterium]
MAPSRLQERWLLQVADAGLRIVLAEGDDPRIRDAARRLADSGVTPVLVTESAGIAVDGIDVLDPREPGDAVSAVLADAVERQAAKRDLTGDERAALAVDPVTVGVAAVRAGRAHGCVAGATRPSADVARAAIRVVGMAPGRSTLSSSFLMLMPDGQALAYGDCAVVPEPDAEQLADIAADTADTFAALAGEEPVVALLSFSTKGSAEHESLDVVRDAVDLVRRQRPDLAVDGELQFDTAFVPHVGATKAPGSPVAGRANVFIFPNLAAGNIAYKVTERLAGAEAFGPLFQGLASPVNDLSRGCSAQDVYNISAITAVQALRALNDAAQGGE